MGEIYDNHHRVTPVSELSLDSDASCNSIISNHKVRCGPTSNTQIMSYDSIGSVISSIYTDKGSYIDISCETRRRTSTRKNTGKTMQCCNAYCNII